LTAQTKDQKNHVSELEQFYRSSEAYLEHLKVKAPETFESYVNVSKQALIPGATVLDCGCGIGMSSYLLAKEGFEVTGTDLSPLFISEAKQRYGKIPNLRFSVQDAEAMSFPDESFDTVCSIAMLEHVTDVQGVLKEMCRVLKRRGRLIIFMPNHLDPFQHLMGCIKWREKDTYKPWEGMSRIKAFLKFISTSYLAIAKATAINKTLYYLEPVLSQDKNTCGEDFDTTWLANWFDLERLFRNEGLWIEDNPIRGNKSRISRMMQALRLPRGLQSFYIKIRTTCVVVGVKNKPSRI